MEFGEKLRSPLDWDALGRLLGGAARVGASPLIVRSVTFGETLNLDDVTALLPLRFIGCHFLNGISARRSVLESMSFEAKTCVHVGPDEWSVRADGLRLNGSLRVLGSEFTGGLDLQTARIQGRVEVEDSMLGHPTHRASLNLRGAAVAGGLRVVDASELKGHIEARGATIAAGVVLRRSKVGTNRSGRSFDGENLVSGSVFVQHTLAPGATSEPMRSADCLAGSLRLGGAVISGTLVCWLGAALGVDRHFRSLDADHVHVTGDVRLVDSRFDGYIRLRGAVIDGDLVVHDSTTVGACESGEERTDRSDGCSIRADRVQVGGNIVVGRFDPNRRSPRLKGAFHLPWARVGGNVLIAHGAELGKDIGGLSLFADGIRCTDLDLGRWVSSTFCGHPDVAPTGTMRRWRWKSRRWLEESLIDLQEWQRRLRGRWSRHAPAAGEAPRGGPTELAMAGGFSMLHGRVSGRLGLNEGTTIGPSELDQNAIVVAESDIDKLVVREGLTWSGRADLSDCRVRLLDLSPAVWNPHLTSRQWIVDGFEPERLIGKVDGGEVESWLRTAVNRNSSTKGADIQAFRNLAVALRAGHQDEDATRVLVAMREVHNPPWLRIVLRPIGQGFRPARAVAWFSGVWVLAVLFAWVGGTMGAFVATAPIGANAPWTERSPALVSSDHCDSATYPCFSPLLYATELAVPIVDLGSTAQWAPKDVYNADVDEYLDRESEDGLWASWPATWWDIYILAVRLLGWGFGGLFVIGALNLAIESRRE